MKTTQRSKWLSLMMLVACALPSQALEERKFFNADKSQSFPATLTDYNEAKKLVTVTLKSGKKKKFSINLLSKEDQEYVKANATILAAARDINVSFKEVKGETTRSKSGLVRTRKTPTGYEIMVYNRSDKTIENLEVRYSYYYCVGSSSATGPRHTPKVLKGVISYPKMYGKYNETRKTDEVVLIRESKKGVAPPAPSGGGGIGGGGG